MFGYANTFESIYISLNFLYCVKGADTTLHPEKMKKERYKHSLCKISGPLPIHKIQKKVIMIEQYLDLLTHSGPEIIVLQISALCSTLC